MGSSAIRRTVTLAVTGPTGPIGSTGPDGPIGGNTGSTGPTGATGNYITSVEYDTNLDPTIKTSDGKSFLILGLSTTVATGSIAGITTPSGFNLLKSFSGGTLNIRGLSFIGTLSYTIDDNSIKIVPQDQGLDLTLSANSSPNRVVYADTASNIKETKIEIIDDSFSFNSLGTRYAFLDSSFNTAVVPQIPRESISEVANNFSDISEYFVGVDPDRGVYIDVTKSSVYVINTPIGIAGFSMNTALYDVGDVVSLTMFVNGNDIWSFPSNVYFENKQNSTLFGCGMNIMNLVTMNKGLTWYATITDRGYGATGCRDFDAVGSCCYSDAEGNFECDDYVNKSYCDRLNGTFAAALSCDRSCNIVGLTAFCCSEGKCLTGVSEDECEYFGGVFYTTNQNLSCADNVGTNRTRLCYDKCQSPVSCCKNGVCLGEMSALVCDKIFGGRGVSGTCDEIDCCKEIPFYGACCKTESNGTSSCRETHIYDCLRSNNETFMGHGSVCDGTSCCQSESPLYACCIDGNCSLKTEAQCTAGCGIIQKNTNGSFKTSCAGVVCPQEPVACCKDGICTVANSIVACASSGGQPQFNASGRIKCCTGVSCTPPQQYACCDANLNSCQSNQTASSCPLGPGIYFPNNTLLINDCAGCPKICCTSNGCIAFTTEEACTSAGGTVKIGKLDDFCSTICPPQPPVPLDQGLCCGRTAEWAKLTRAQCAAKDPQAYFFPNPILGDYTNAPYQWGCSAGDPNGIGEIGRDCDFCYMTRKVVEVTATPQPDVGIPDIAIQYRCIFNKVLNLPNGYEEFGQPFYNKRGSVTGVYLHKGYNFANQSGPPLADPEFRSCCGAHTVYIPSGNSNEPQQDAAYCFFDSFSMGTLGIFKKVGSGAGFPPLIATEFYETCGFPDDTPVPTQACMRKFLYEFYLKDAAYVYADYAAKICDSSCARTINDNNFAGPGSISITCPNGTVLNCDIENGSGIGDNTTCALAYSVAVGTIPTGQAGSVSCPSCGGGVTPLPLGPPPPGGVDPDGPGTPQGVPNEYCAWVQVGTNVDLSWRDDTPICLGAMSPTFTCPNPLPSPALAPEFQWLIDPETNKCIEFACDPFTRFPCNVYKSCDEESI